MKALDKVRLDTPSKFTPQYLAKITHKEMKRAELVRDMAEFLLKEYDGKISNLIKQAPGKMGGKNGLFDYHISRVLLRSGVVKVLSKRLLLKLKKFSPVTNEEDLAIRQVCIEAIVLMANKKGKRIRKVQGILWALEQDCCHEEGPSGENCRLKNCLCKKYLAYDILLMTVKKFVF